MKNIRKSKLLNCFLYDKIINKFVELSFLEQITGQWTWFLNELKKYILDNTE